MRILVCEDEKNLNRLICKKLTAEGYGVDSCFDGEEALEYVDSAEYDLVILDVMMPKIDGYEVAKKMREFKKEYPILFLTAKDSTEDVVYGLDIGANDYIVKPFSFEVLLARIRVIIRTKPQKNIVIFKSHDLEVNTSSKTVIRAGNEIKLTTKEYAILEYMIYNKNTVLTREQIENSIWSYDYEGGSDLVKVYIRYLRRKLDDPYDVKLIQTIRGVRVYAGRRR